MKNDECVSSVKKIDRINYVILAILFGGAGVHNFYAGQNGAGILKIVLSIASIIAIDRGKSGILIGIVIVICNLLWILSDILSDPNRNAFSSKISGNGLLKSVFWFVVFAGALLLTLLLLVK